MPKGISVHVGVNHTLAAEISAPPLKGCVKDAQAMHRLARAGGYGGPEPLVEEEATFDAVIFEIKKAAAELQEGDSFLFTFSGHGTRRAAEDFSETDSKDETLVLRDRLLVDNVFRRLLWPKFAAGVHCVAIADSCYSGGSFMLPIGDEALALNAVGAFAGEGAMNVVGKSLLKVNGRSLAMRGAVTLEEEDEFSVNRNSMFEEKTISLEQALIHYSDLETFYTEIRNSLPAQAPPILASLTLIGACDENLKALDGEPNGFFTEQLLKAFEQNHQLTFEQLITQLQTEFELSPRRPTLDFAGLPLPAVFATKPAFTV
jgi:hypothetical protein